MCLEGAKKKGESFLSKGKVGGGDVVQENEKKRGQGRDLLKETGKNGDVVGRIGRREVSF